MVAGDMAVIRTNCIGVVNYLDGTPVAISPSLGIERPDHGVALIAQSGTIIGNMVQSERSLPVSHLFSMGNQSVTETADAIAVVAYDPRVDAIMLYIEGLRDAEAFARAATRAFNATRRSLHSKPMFRRWTLNSHFRTPDRWSARPDFTTRSLTAWGLSRPRPSPSSLR